MGEGRRRGDKESESMEEERGRGRQRWRGQEEGGGRRRGRRFLSHVRSCFNTPASLKGVRGGEEKGGATPCTVWHVFL